MSLTIDDVKLLMDTFATKQDLEYLKEDLRSEMVTKAEFSQALGKLDYIIGEIQTYRQEQAVTSQRVTDIEEDVASLSKRMKKVEQVPSVAAHLK